MARVLNLEPLTPATAPILPGPPARSSLPAIDWERGLLLWSQESLLRTAIARFLQDSAQQLAALQQAAQAGDGPQIAAKAHRLRGAAANLALLGVQQAAAELEAATAGPGRPPARPTAWPELLLALEAALAAAQAALGRGAPTVEQDRDMAELTLDAPACAAVRAAIGMLAPALASGEFPEQPLAVLGQYLGAARLAGLRDALEHFDFDRAREQLQQLQQDIHAACGTQAAAPGHPMTAP
ncbi:Hpt domain-containing protein [Melaminivora sp.]